MANLNKRVKKDNSGSIKDRRTDLFIKRSAEKILSALRLSGCEVDIFLVSDELMRDINMAYRKKDKPTTVLSFEDPDIPHPETRLRHLGEIYLAPKYISAHNEDIGRLLVHGILHLVGYDHIKKTDEIRMEKKEKEILRKAGFII
ncbi:MAG: rRNA maturation RNase YbeY [Candidatus Colwellbacteria bacterium]|nr:rRNA maturation RNase YbeY [Candidatus Colwellbacteria bacterium]